MKILLTGATGYIAKRLLPVLLAKGHEVICCVRDKSRFHTELYLTKNLSVVEADFLDPESLSSIPQDVAVAYYLIHSMTAAAGKFKHIEATAAENFKTAADNRNIKQVIYLSGIVNEVQLSEHLDSRKNVARILSTGNYALTTLRAGIIVGSGSASFEIIRDLVEKLPVMIAPKWLHTQTQPIAIRDVINFLSGVLLHEATFNQSFDIGGPDILTYKEMLLRFARVRKLKRWIFVVPLMTPKLSSYWLYFITSTSYVLAQNLVDSMKIKVVCHDNRLEKILNIQPITYEKAIELAFDKIEQNQVLSSWKDSFVSGILSSSLSKQIEVPVYGCFKDERKIYVQNPEAVLQNIWSIGGKKGWYYANILWKFRGFIDKLVGGVGLRRGRTNKAILNAGDALDFWRVLLADKQAKRLLLFAEMKLPGEAWLELKLDDQQHLYQTATFRPKGLWGRLYWYALYPVHSIIFNGMIKRIGMMA